MRWVIYCYSEACYVRIQLSSLEASNGAKKSHLPTQFGESDRESSATRANLKTVRSLTVLSLHLMLINQPVGNFHRKYTNVSLFEKNNRNVFIN